MLTSSTTMAVKRQRVGSASILVIYNMMTTYQRERKRDRNRELEREIKRCSKKKKEIESERKQESDRERLKEKGGVREVRTE